MSDTALKLADELSTDYYADVRVTAAAAELRRLHTENEALRTERDKALSDNQRWIALANTWAQEVKTEQRLSFRSQLHKVEALNAELVEALRETLPVLHDSFHEELEAKVHRVLQKWEASK